MYTPNALNGGSAAGEKMAATQAQEAMRQQAKYQQDYAGPQGQAVPQISRTSDSLIQEIGQRLEYLTKLSRRVDSIADRACGLGAQCAGTMNDAPTPAPNSLQAKLGMVIQIMDGLSASFEQSANRLDTFV